MLWVIAILGAPMLVSPVLMRVRARNRAPRHIEQRLRNGTPAITFTVRSLVWNPDTSPPAFVPASGRATYYLDEHDAIRLRLVPPHDTDVS